MRVHKRCIKEACRTMKLLIDLAFDIYNIIIVSIVIVIQIIIIVLSLLCLLKLHSTSFLTLTDVDECSRSLDNCHVNASCQNNVGSFTCACNVGHEGDGINCQGKLLYLLINREWGLYGNYPTVALLY